MDQLCVGRVASRILKRSFMGNRGIVECNCIISVNQVGCFSNSVIYFPLHNSSRTVMELSSRYQGHRLFQNSFIISYCICMGTILKLFAWIKIATRAPNTVSVRSWRKRELTIGHRPCILRSFSRGSSNNFCWISHWPHIPLWRGG